MAVGMPLCLQVNSNVVGSEEVSRQIKLKTFKKFTHQFCLRRPETRILAFQVSPIQSTVLVFNNWKFSASLSIPVLGLFITVCKFSTKNCRWLGSNPGTLVLKATALLTEPKPLSKDNDNLNHLNIVHPQTEPTYQETRN